MKKKTKDYLKFTNIEIYQDDKMFCINSDTAILGHSLKLKEGLRILDIGTNNGALLLYASRFKPKTLVGIDINDKALELAKENLSMNNIEAKLYHSDLKDYHDEAFDVIITNPPFFKCNNLKDNEDKKLAMFDIMLPLDELFKGFKRLLKDNGSIFMIYEATRLNEIYLKCIEYSFKLMELTMVYDNNKPYAKRVLCKLKKGPLSEIKIHKPIIIKNGTINF